MDKNEKVLAEAWIKSNTAKAILIVFALLFLAVLSWSNINSTKSNENIRLVADEMAKQSYHVEKMINNIAEIKELKKCVNTKLKDAENEYREAKVIIGEVLKENGVAFPVKLNSALLKYDEARDEIKDCLVFPEDVK